MAQVEKIDFRQIVSAFRSDEGITFNGRRYSELSSYADYSELENVLARVNVQGATTAEINDSIGTLEAARVKMLSGVETLRGSYKNWWKIFSIIVYFLSIRFAITKLVDRTLDQFERLKSLLNQAREGALRAECAESQAAYDAANVKLTPLRARFGNHQREVDEIKAKIEGIKEKIVILERQSSEYEEDTTYNRVRNIFASIHLADTTTTKQQSLSQEIHHLKDEINRLLDQKSKLEANAIIINDEITRLEKEIAGLKANYDLAEKAKSELPQPINLKTCDPDVAKDKIRRFFEKTGSPQVAEYASKVFEKCWGVAETFTPDVDFLPEQLEEKHCQFTITLDGQKNLIVDKDHVAVIHVGELDGNQWVARGRIDHGKVIYVQGFKGTVKSPTGSFQLRECTFHSGKFHITSDLDFKWVPQALVESNRTRSYRYDELEEIIPQHYNP